MLLPLLRAADVNVHVSSGTDWGTLILAVIGVVLSLAALGWQLYSVLFITGSRVRVMIAYGLAGPGSVITFKDGTDTAWLSSYRSQGYTRPVIAVNVANRGRGETSISEVGIRLRPSEIVVKETSLTPLLPHPLKGEHGQSWYIDGAMVAAAVKTTVQMWPAQAGKVELEAIVELGSGKVVRSRNRLHG